jgi:hypothetical protein
MGNFEQFGRNLTLLAGLSLGQPSLAKPENLHAPAVTATQIQTNMDVQNNIDSQAKAPGKNPESREAVDAKNNARLNRESKRLREEKPDASDLSLARQQVGDVLKLKEEKAKHKAWDKEIKNPTAVLAGPVPSGGNSSTLTEGPVSLDKIGDTSYQQIHQLDFLEESTDMQSALDALAKVIGEYSGDTLDRHQVWKMIRGGFLSDGGLKEASLQDLVDSTFNRGVHLVIGRVEVKDLENVDASGSKRLKELGQDNANTVLENGSKILEILKANGEDISDRISEIMDAKDGEHSRWESQKPAQTHVMDQLYDYKQFGPGVRLSLFKKIFWNQDKEDAAIVSSDTWMSRAKQGDLDGDALPFLSQARAYEMAMNEGNNEALRNYINIRIEKGKNTLNALQENSLLESHGFRETKANTAEPLPALTNTTQLTKDQIEAFQHGDMLLAAEELGMYESGANIEDGVEKSSGGKTPLDIALDQAMRESGLEEKDIENARENAKQKLTGYITFLFEEYLGKDPAERGNFPDYLKVALGTHYEIIEGVSLEATLIAGEDGTRDGLQLAFRTRAGATVDIPLPKEDGKVKWSKWDAKAFAHWNGAIGEDGLENAGPSAGVNVRRELWESTWGADLGAYADLENMGINLGLSRDIQKLLEKKMNAYIVENAEGISNARTTLEGQIDAQPGLTQNQRIAAKEAMNGYVNELVEQNAMKNQTKWYKQLKLQGGGVMFNFGRKENKGSHDLGAYFDIALGFRIKRFYLPNDDLEMNGKDQGIDRWKDLTMTTETYTAEVPTFLSDSRSGSDRSVDAIAGLQTAITSLNQNLNGLAKYEMDTNWANVSFPTLEPGPVEIHASQGIILIADSTTGKIGVLTDDPTKTPIVKILTETETLGFGGNSRRILITTNDSENPMDFSGYPDYIQANQQANGTLGDVKNIGSGASRIINRNQTTAITSAPDFKGGVMSKKSAESYAKTMDEAEWAQKDALKRDERIVVLTDPEAAIAREVGQDLSEQFNTDYAELFGDPEETKQMVIAAYKKYGVENPSSNQIIFAWNDAMVTERPHRNPEQVKKWMGWSSAALSSRLGEELAQPMVEHYKTVTNLEELKANEGTPPPNSRIIVSIHEKGDQNYSKIYNPVLDGPILDLTTFDPSDASAIKKAADKFGKDDAWVKNMHSKILSQEKLQKENISYSDPIQNILSSSAGYSFMEEADDIVGAGTKTKLAEMLASGNESTDQALANNARKWITDLNIKGSTDVNGKPVRLDWVAFTGFYEACVNPALGMYPQLKYAETTPAQVAVGAAETSAVAAIRPGQALDWNTAHVTPSSIPGIGKGEKVSGAGWSSTDDGDGSNHGGGFQGNNSNNGSAAPLSN